MLFRSFIYSFSDAADRNAFINSVGKDTTVDVADNAKKGCSYVRRMSQGSQMLCGIHKIGISTNILKLEFNEINSKHLAKVSSPFERPSMSMFQQLSHKMVLKPAAKAATPSF